MILGLMGKKVGMTMVFDAEGLSVPVTVVKVGDNIITQRITKKNTAIKLFKLAVSSSKKES